MENESKLRGYSLVIVPFFGGEDNKFSLMERDRIEEIDEITCCFSNLQDMEDNFYELYGKRIPIMDAYVSRDVSLKKYDVLYKDDIFDVEKVKSRYGSLILGNKEYFYKKSPVRFVNISKDDYDSYSVYAKYCLLAYFKDNNYRNIRGAYLELKKLGLSHGLTISKDVDIKYEYYSYDEYINSLILVGDWDTIYREYSLDELDSLVKVRTIGSKNNERH